MSPSIFRKIQQKRLLVAMVLFFLVFILTRIPYYFHYGIPYIFDDSEEFNDLALQLISGDPNFGGTTPFYPLFLAGAWLFSHNIIIVPIFQSLFTALSACIFIYKFYHYYTRYTILAGLAITIFTSLIVYLNFESVLMAESLYVSMTVIWVCSLIFAIKRRTSFWWAGASVLLITVILIRPAGLYLIPLSVLIIIYMIVNKYSVKAISCFILPALILFLGTCTYNLIKIERFSISSRSEYMIGNVLGFVEEDGIYPGYINTAIEELVTRKYPEGQKKFIRNSWNITTVQTIQVNHQYLMHSLLDAIRAENPHNPEKFIADCNMVIWQAIKTHPSEFMKFTAIQMIHYFAGLNYKNMAAFPFLIDYKTCFTSRLARYYHDKANKSGRFYLFKSPSLNLEQVTAVKNSLDNDFLHRFNQQFSMISNMLFRNHLWLIIYFYVLLVSTFKLIKSRFSAENEFIIFIICCMILLSMMFHSLVNIVMIRYTYTLFWIYYLSPVLLLILHPDKWRISVSRIKISSPGNPDSASFTL